MMRRRLADLFWVVAFGLALAACAQRLQRIEHTDPDRFYHYALSRFVAEASGDVLPPVIGLGWDTHFDEKEWLFHQLTALGWRVAHERGVDLVCFMLAWLDVVLVYALCRRTLAPLAAGLLVSATCLASSLWLFRVLMIRPQVLGLACSLALVHALLWRRTWAVALVATLFALSYHALFIPLALVGLFALNEWPARTGLKGVAAVLLGLALGSFASPAFPGNLWSTWVGLKIAFTTARDVNAGLENAPLPWLEWLVALGGSFAGWLFALASWRQPDPERHRRFFVISAAVFWGLSLRVPRAAEYAVPLTTVALAFAASQLRPWRVASVAGVVCAALLPGQWRLTRMLPSHTYNEGLEAAVQTLPAEGQATVFNCSFADGAYVLYFRPNLRVLDVLDPLLLKTKRPDLAKSREYLQIGGADPWDVVTRLFPSDYLICGYPQARVHLDDDPRFLRLYQPAGPSSGPAVYQVLR